MSKINTKVTDSVDFLRVISLATLQLSLVAHFTYTARKF